MKAQWVRLGGAALILSAVIACASDRVTGVAPGGPELKKMKLKQRPDEVEDTVTVAARSVPLAQELFASQVIGPAGGTLELPEAGLKIVVPKNAVSSNTTFTVKAFQGSLLAYDFGPHGTTFKTPLRIEQDVRGVVFPEGESVVAGYFPEQPDLLVDDVVGTIDERLPAELDLSGAKVRFDVHHFSGYLVASGRSRTH